MANKLHIVAVTALIKSQDKERFLVVKRGEDEVAHPGKWSLPGGKLEEGERVIDALRREVHEEVGLSISDEKRYLRDFGFMRGGEQWVVGLCFEVYATNEEVSLADDFDDHRWVTPQELKEMDCIPTVHEEVGIAFQKS